MYHHKGNCAFIVCVCVCVCVCVWVAQLCPTLCDPMVCPWGSLDKNTGVGSYSLLQGIFPALGSNSGFLNCRQIFCRLSYTARLLFEESLVNSCQVLNKAEERGRKGFFTFYFIYLSVNFFFWFQYGPRDQKNFKKKCIFKNYYENEKYKNLWYMK